jgi:flagellar biosynthesis protein FlhA
MIEQTRKRLSRQITSGVTNETGTVHAVTMSRTTEDLLRSTMVAADGEPVMTPDIEVARNLIDQLEVHASKMASAGLPTVVIAPSDLRRPLYDFAARFLSDLSVITARELTPGTHLEPTAMIQLAPAAS